MIFRTRSERARDAREARHPVSATADETVAPGMRIAAAWSWRILVVAGAIALFCYLFVTLKIVAIPFMVAIVLAALLVPAANFLQRHHWPKWLAVVLCVVGVIVVVGGLVTLIVLQVRGSIPDLQKQTTERIADLRSFLAAPPFNLSSKDIDGYLQDAGKSIQKDSSGILSGALSIGSTFGHVLAGLLITLFSMIFILIDGRGIFGWVVRLFPRRARAAVRGAGEAGWVTLTSFVRVQIGVAFIDAVGIGLGAWILGLVFGGFPLVLPIAIAVFLGSFIPVVGAVLTGALAVFVALVYLGPIPALIMVAIVILVQQIEGHVLQPFLMGSAVKVHPVAVVLSVAAAGFIAGIPGAFFAVPLVAVLNVMIGYIARGDWRHDPHPDRRDVTSSRRGQTGVVQ
ncbi:AI-2E family transporter [Pseudolysinimonas sp.]|uniref:AI-2E family transporter n=1 Tax=Pseudolysinimonas sp. TaxID=2680009 RepID=UPI003F7E743B